jgi:hypothetical protein
MKELLLVPFGILVFIFYLPGLIVWFPVMLFKVYILKHKVKSSDEPRKGFHLEIVSIILWIIIIGWNVYQNQFYSISYVYACPADDDSSKCYKVEADYVREECEDYEYRHKSRCTDPYFNPIYFRNGGSVTFTECLMHKEGQWICEEEGGETWEVQFAETVKVRK